MKEKTYNYGTVCIIRISGVIEQLMDIINYSMMYFSVLYIGNKNKIIMVIVLINVL